MRNLMRRMTSILPLNARELEIKQSDREWVISNGDISDEYVYGQKSIVSMLSGAADRRTGWKGNIFIVESQSPDGPGVLQTYQLSPDGRELITSTKFSGRGPELTIKRVYNRSSDKAERPG